MLAMAMLAMVIWETPALRLSLLVMLAWEEVREGQVVGSN